MNKGVMAVAAVLLAAVVGAATFMFGGEPAQINPPQTELYFDQNAAIDDRVRALETAVAEERNARQLLEEELQVLYAEIEVLGQQRDETDEQRESATRENRERFEELRAQRSARANLGSAERLVNAGFSPDRAEWLVQRESELQMEAMQARFDARRTGESIDPLDPTVNTGSALRAEIGDAEYEQYLQANNRPISVSVGGVLESSPAQNAGLQRGDQIVSYNGNRVFSVADLNQQTIQGEPGEAIVVDIMRDGSPMQIVLPRGPLGVSTGRFQGRR